MADRFTEACLSTVRYAALRVLPLVGAVDQAIDTTDVLQSPGQYRRLAAIYANGET